MMFLDVGMKFAPGINYVIEGYSDDRGLFALAVVQAVIFLRGVVMSPLDVSKVNPNRKYMATLSHGGETVKSTLSL